MEEEEIPEREMFAYQQLHEFKGFVHSVIDGADFATILGASLGGVPVTVVAVVNGHSWAPFAIYLDEATLDQLEGLHGGLCEDCAAEEAEEILRHVDLDAPIPFSTTDKPDDNDDEERHD